MVEETPILTRVKENLPMFTRSQKKVADYILKNPMQAAFSTVDEIAKAADTSTTTVVRLALTLEYSGYAELQKGLQGFLKNRSSPSTRLETSFHDKEKRDHSINNIAQQQLENINNTYAHLSDKAVFLAAKKLSSARHTYIFGQRSCYGVGHYLAYNINRVLGNCDFIYNGSIESVEHIHRITSKDVIIVLSMSRYVKQVVRFAQQARKRGAFIISISDGYASPFVSISDILFFSEVTSTDFHNAMTSSMFIADILIGVLAKQNLNKAIANLHDTEKILLEMDVNVIPEPLKV
jgi:DNA-binding MurR/RpiR family transcriptional regulator